MDVITVPIKEPGVSPGFFFYEYLNPVIFYRNMCLYLCGIALVNRKASLKRDAINLLVF